jgi:toxin ParE1/3/4
MSRYFVTPQARADLIDLWLYIANDRPGAADRLYERLQQRFRLLAANPGMGEDRSQLARDVRQTTLGSYVVLFRFRPERLEILRVIHSARDVPKEFHRLWKAE